ncbi:cytochrome C oxidase [Agrobacterium sp. TS43]|jgi:cytochrome c oxidase subunit III|uniref:cytochrome c oxidase subunit 3 n=1 Tax=unclassified Agrobacterium TaxID=2632611 RepID=UPI0002CB1D92|nr:MULTISPECIES: cytochrome c oxidase subunit 3 [unclassified Agrobacterium]EMS97326.1 cytochrome-c oxidase subunit III protein [Agrobacterium tumefaciens str. Cherry 2E-2-2]EPR15674.1 cytochrome C oxidase [Agrobacterium radiobacter DSM 30147]MBS0258029.1 cytochrome c oxidase subunit 3 [Pseudomonadota bacterium]KVK50865.1 cytochrome C oxidase [Agrobacterium sp. JL28]KVK51110.1 cytochrome C oxidase [Agrobacterium sp. LY4]
MSAILVFMAGIAGIIGWWMARQRLASKPWLEVGLAGDAPQMQGSSATIAKVGLGIFLAVVGALFTLLISAYLGRMGGADWWGIPIPGLLWVNTAALAASSLALQWAKTETRPDHRDRLNAALVTAFATAVFFVAGQFLAWRQLISAGYILADNPSNSFFYMITGLHGLHILGGLFVLGRTAIRARSEPLSARMRLSVELCAIYWHFMLVVWLVLFALFAGWANSFVDLCRQLVT